MWAVLGPFAFTALLLAMVPGQGTAMLLRQAMAGGLRAALLSALGTCAGLLIWAVASAVGLSAIFVASPLAYNALRWVGALYLAFLSIQTLVQLKKRGPSFAVSSQGGRAGFLAFRLGLTTNLLNVKAAVFSVAFIPQFVPNGFPIARGILTLGLVQALVSFAWAAFLGTSISRVTEMLASEKARRILTLISAIGFLILSLSLLIARQGLSSS